jgi:hypothetical protein
MTAVLAIAGRMPKKKATQLLDGFTDALSPAYSAKDKRMIEFAKQSKRIIK